MKTPFNDNDFDEFYLPGGPGHYLKEVYANVDPDTILSNTNTKIFLPTQVSITPTIEAVKALDGRIFAMLDATECETLEFYRAQGRKFGVTVSIINQADPETLAAAKSCQEADQIMKLANSVVSVIVHTLVSTETRKGMSC